jgi:Flp pilus assembly pilin Flp
MGAIKRLISDERGGFIIQYVPLLSIMTVLLTIATADVGGSLMMIWWELIKLVY